MLSNGFHDIPPGKIAMVVTYLEMTSKPAIKSVPWPPGVTFRRVTPDLDWYRDVFKRVGSFEWLWYGRLRLSDADLDAAINDPKVEIYTLKLDGQDEALLELSFDQDGTCELAYFGLTPRLIGTGCGRALMNEAITRAWEHPISRFHLHTCTTDSPQALSFYRRSGFTPVRQAIEIDDDPRVIGVLPESAASRIPILTP